MSNEVLPRLTLLQAARRVADLYCLWRLCGKPGCRRAQACRGAVHRCLPSLSLVPVEALDFLESYEHGMRQGLTFEEVMARNEDAWQSMEDWRSLVLSTLPQGTR